VTFDEMMQEHLKALRRRGRTEDTIANRRQHLAQLGTFLAGREATLPLLREWSDSLAARGLKVRSRWTSIVNIRAFYNWAAQEELIPANPALRLEKPRLPKHLPQALTVDQVTKLLDTVAAGRNPERDEALILFMLETGCRRGGAAGLRLGDLDLGHGSARVVEKGDRERYVYFSERTVEALRRWLQVRDPLKFDAKFRDSDLVFGLGPWGLGVFFEKLGPKAGMHVHAHQLRHTCAVMRLMQGIDAGSLIAIMGWAGPEMLKTYGVLAAGQVQQRAMQTTPMNAFAPVPAPSAQPKEPAPPIRGRILPTRRRAIPTA
jgi:integrase/recombinase XerD